MKMVRYLPGLLALIFLLGGCATIVPPKYPFQATRTYEKDYDTVWSSVIEIFAQRNISIKTIEKVSGIVVSENSKVPFQVQPDLTYNSSYCDCGSPGGLVILTDMKGRFNVFVRKITENATSVQVNTAYHALKQMGMHFVLGWNWECNSKGYMESIIFDDLDSRLGPGH